MNPHSLTYSPVDHYEPGDRARFAREDRADIAHDRAYLRSMDRGIARGLAPNTFGWHALDDEARGHHDTSGAEHQARKVDALYRAHLLYAAADRMTNRVLHMGAESTDLPDGRVARAAARAQEAIATDLTR